jgi:hypothetical protein
LTPLVLTFSLKKKPRIEVCPLSLRERVGVRGPKDQGLDFLIPSFRPSPGGRRCRDFCDILLRKKEPRIEVCPSPSGRGLG